MAKVDLKKELKPLYTASAKAPTLVDAPKLNFLMVDGYGHPNNSPEFHTAIEVLYSTAYTLKFQSKKADPGADWTIMPLEGLWWREKPDADWSWTLMIAQPPLVTKAQFKAARTGLAKKKGSDAYEKVRLESLKEGRSVQFLHVGSYEAEEPSIARMVSFAQENGYEFAGKHHEIYITDPQRVPADRLKTILRYPVKKRSALSD